MEALLGLVWLKVVRSTLPGTRQGPKPTQNGRFGQILRVSQNRVGYVRYHHQPVVLINLRQAARKNSSAFSSWAAKSDSITRARV